MSHIGPTAARRRGSARAGKSEEGGVQTKKHLVRVQMDGEKMCVCVWYHNKEFLSQSSNFNVRGGWGVWAVCRGRKVSHLVKHTTSVIAIRRRCPIGMRLVMMMHLRAHLPLLLLLLLLDR
jgi:hypothetical protein